MAMFVRSLLLRMGAGASAAGSSTASGPTYPSGYVPARSSPATSPIFILPTQTSPAPAVDPVVIRVRVIRELAFERGDVIQVVD